MFLALWVTLAYLDWMESMVNTFPPPTTSYLVLFPIAVLASSSSLYVSLPLHPLPFPFLTIFFFFVFQVPLVRLVLQGRLVQAQLRETEVTLGSQASPAPLAQKANLEALEALEFLVVPVLKVKWPDMFLNKSVVFLNVF